MTIDRRKFVLGCAAIVGGAVTSAALPTSAVAAQPSPTPTGTAASGDVLRELTGITAAYFTDRARRVSSNRPGVTDSRALPLGSSLQRLYADEMPLLGDQAKRCRMFHGGYRTGQSSVTLADVQVSGGSAVARVVERTALFFERTEMSTARSTQYISNHEATYVKTAGGWKISTVRYIDASRYSAPITQFHESVPDFVKPFISPDREVMANQLSESDRISPAYSPTSCDSTLRGWLTTPIVGGTGRTPATQGLEARRTARTSCRSACTQGDGLW